MGTELGLTGPGVGAGWERLAEAVAARIPPAEIEGIWAFRPIRQEGKEHGTAILSQVDGEHRERRRIFTARYVLAIKGKERGKFAAVLEEVGSGPVEALDELLRGVEKRADDEPPQPVARELWFPPSAADAPSREG